MKKLVFTASAFLIILSSCSSDSSSSTASGDVLLHKIIQTDVEGTLTTTMQYSGNKLIGTTSDDGSYAEITYSGDLITKWENFDADDELVDVTIYTYDGSGRLTQSVWLDYWDESGEKMTYVHNGDGSISYNSYSGTLVAQTEFSHSGKIYNNKFDENVPASGGFEAHIDSHTFTYDNKNNPYKNVTGFDKTVFAHTNSGTNAVNNATQETHSNTLGLSEVTMTATYTYNADGYPLTEVEDSQGDILEVEYIYE